MTPRPLLLSLIVVISFPLLAAPRGRSVAHPAVSPRCTMITGTPAVTFTRDFGTTLTPTAQKLSGIAYTYGLTATDEPNTLMAFHKNDLLISTDAGCSWRLAAEIPGADFPPSLAAAKGGRVYVWSENREFLVRYDARGVARLKPPAAFIGFVVDKANPDRIRGGSSGGNIWESTDAGETWAPVGLLGGNALYYRFAFDPNDLDHIVSGKAVEGAHVTRDGGRTWTKATGFASSANVFNVVISPADPNVVWAMGLDLADGSRFIYLSEDGGSSFRPVVEDSATVTLINGPIMAVHPTNRNLLFFVFGTFFQGYGTDLFRYDAAADALMVTHSDYHGIDAIAFSPTEPNLMYLGLENESAVQ